MNQCPKSGAELKEMEIVLYASAVSSLLHAIVCARSDIAFIVGILGRYQNNPGMTHWKIAKRVIRYLQGSKDFRLTYSHLIVWNWLDI